MALLPLAAYRDVFEPLRGRRVGYVRLPGNVGDGLLEMAAFGLMRAFAIDVRIIDPTAGPGDVDEVVVAAGGNMGSFYSRALAIRVRVLAWGLPVTILPQSFISPEPLPYSRVFVREKDSLRLRPDAHLAPDLALGLDVAIDDEPDLGEGVWLRADAEALFARAPSQGDPARVCRTPLEYLRLAARHEHVITDRLHFAIAALLCGCRATLLPNIYHKNRAVYDCWLRELGCGWRDTPLASARAVPGPAAGQGPQLCFVTVCMGRLDHLRQTLPAALAQPDCRVVVVDYSCPERCGDWVEQNYPQARVVRVPGQSEFNLARGRNAGARAAGTPWLCFLDADVAVAPRFAATILPLLLPGGYYRPVPAPNGTAGTVAVSRADFERVGGYDECYRGYGGEDADLYNALRMTGAEARAFPGELLHHLPHPDEDRTRFYAIKDLWESVAVARAYHRIKFDIAERIGRLLPLAERERLYALVRPAVQSWWAAGRTRPLEVSVVVETNGPGGARRLTYQFEPTALAIGPVA